MAIQFDTSIQFLKGVGPKLGSVFEKRGIKTVGDLIEFYPRAYEDRRAARNIASLKPDEIVSLKAQIVSVSSFAMGRTKRKIYDIVIQDGSGRIHCKYFRVPYKGYFEKFSAQQYVRIVGKVTNYKGRLEFHHPDLKDFNEQDEEELKDQLIPIYVEIEGVSTYKIGKLVQLAMQSAGDVQDKLPADLLKKYKLMNRAKAIQAIHEPPLDSGNEYNELKSPAHRRLIFEEFFWLELFLAAKKSGFKKEAAPVIQNPGSKIEKLLTSLSFAPTNAQKKVFAQIQSDLQSGEPMHRLVQGDVGSGKTLVALMSCVYAIESGFQTTIMAPTEILAEQHFLNAKKIFAPLGLKVAILSGKTKTSERRELLESLQKGEIDLCIGTHALIEDDVQFQKLGLVVIDEQHRFGVHQRGHLKAKGECPHFLVMTATPIPRTLAMTVYGDLDVSVIDEMPPGRSPIQTRVVYDSKRPQVMQFLMEQIQKGRQAYFVYPLVEESEKMDLKDAISSFETMKLAYPQVKWGLLHGKMKSEEKDAIMQEFRKNEIQILVSTTVIEVGVDVPNANMMIVEHAERFGLSQLHQLRGRVGRGEHKSFCILMLGKAVSEEAKARTDFMEKTSDGFKIAEFDLELRGPGEFLGTRQSGLAGFKLANLVRDVELLEMARESAFDVIRRDPKLVRTENLLLRLELLRAQGPTALAEIG